MSSVDELPNSPAPSAVSLEERLTLLERSLSVLTTALSARQGDGTNPPATPAGPSGSQPTPRSVVTPSNSGFSLPEPVLPRLAPPRIKPVRKFLTEQGYFHTPIDTSKRSERSEPQDMAKPWKTMHKALAEVLVLLGPPPLPEDLAASTWYERILSAILVYQGEALFEGTRSLHFVIKSSRFLCPHPQGNLVLRPCKQLDDRLNGMLKTFGLRNLSDLDA